MTNTILIIFLCISCSPAFQAGNKTKLEAWATMHNHKTKLVLDVRCRMLDCRAGLVPPSNVTNMMEEFILKAVGIIGYKNSGKTTLLTKLADELNARGYTVSSVKHTSEGIDIANKDTHEHKQFTKQTAIIAPSESAIFFPERKTLEYMFSLLEADFVLIEGLKKERTYPKIICLKSGDNLESLIDGLEVCVYGMELNQNPRTDVPFFDSDKDIGIIADIIERSAFKLPNLNCGGCGYNTCYELALEIIKKNKTSEDCVAMRSDIKIEIDGQIIPLNPFVSKLLVNTIKAMMSSLKNYHNGIIDIHLGSGK